MPRLWLVVPVHGREALTRVCLEQKALLVDELAGLGVEANVVVVGDDGNLDTARELDFPVLERPNVLGRKLNDGFEWACREGGADYVSFCGSDDWVLAEFLADFRPNRVRSAKVQAFVSPAGDQLIVRQAKGSMGGAPWVIPATLLRRNGYRPVPPAREHKMSGMDFLVARALLPGVVRQGGTRATFERRAQFLEEKAAQNWVFDHGPADDLRMVDFKGTGEQITSWSLVIPRQRNTLIRDEADVWGTLATRYPLPLVERMEKLYAEGRA